MNNQFLYLFLLLLLAVFIAAPSCQPPKIVQQEAQALTEPPKVKKATPLPQPSTNNEVTQSAEVEGVPPNLFCVATFIGQLCDMNMECIEKMFVYWSSLPPEQLNNPGTLMKWQEENR